MNEERKRIDIYLEEENLINIFNTISRNDWAEIFEDIAYLEQLIYDYLTTKNDEEKSIGLTRFIVEFVRFLKKNKQKINRILEVENILEKEED